MGFFIGPLAIFDWCVLGDDQRTNTIKTRVLKRLDYVFKLYYLFHTQKWTQFKGHVFSGKEINNNVIPIIFTKWTEVWFSIRNFLSWCFVVILLMQQKYEDVNSTPFCGRWRTRGPSWALHWIPKWHAWVTMRINLLFTRTLWRIVYFLMAY